MPLLDAESEVNEAMIKRSLNIGRGLGYDNEQLMIGRDSGTEGNMLFNMIASGTASVGCDVHDIGIAPTPTLALACKGKSVGLNIVSSFDDERHTSLKIFNSDGTMFNASQIASLNTFIDQDVKLPAYDSIGSMTEHSSAIIHHRKMIFDAVGEADCPVVLDCSSNTASLIAPALLTDLGCDVIAINSQPNGRAPSYQHGIDESSLKDLMDIVHRNAGDIGIAINGDGTCISAVDESGRFLKGETVLALISQYLDPKKMVVPVTASMMVDDIVSGEVIRAPVGDQSIGETVKNDVASFGGGPCGSFIFPELTNSPDGIYAAALLAKIAGENRLNELADALPKYYRSEELIRAEGRVSMSEKISERIATTEYEKMTDTDGWRVEMDGGWYLIRFSTTEPTVRIIAEARDEVYMIGLMDIAKNIVYNSLK